MIPNNSPQSQDLFHACLGFTRQLSQSPGVYCRLEVKIGDRFVSFLVSRLEVQAIFLAKGKVPLKTGETREEGNLLERGCLLLETMVWVLLLRKTLQEHRMDYFPQLHLLLQAVELFPGQGILSLKNTSVGRSWEFCV